LIPQSLLLRNVRGQSLEPRFLGAQDFAWLGRLIEEYRRFEGRPRRDLVRHMKEPLPFACPKFQLAVAHEVLRNHLWKNRGQERRIKPRVIRSALFQAAAKIGDRQSTLAQVSAQFEMTEPELIDALFSDLENERQIDTAWLQTVSPAQLALDSNLHLAKALLARARLITLEVYGQCRPVIRQAKLRGLICVVQKSENGFGFRLSISGPYALFRHTLVYSRYLGELLPFLQNCDEFKLEAVCVLKGTDYNLKLKSGLPIAPRENGKDFDSQVERIFARAFTKLTLNWHLVREPEPVIAGDQLFFPDFEVRRFDSGVKGYIEIVGYWSPQYIRDKIGKLKKARLTNFIICLDRKNACGRIEDWHSLGAQVIEYSKRVDPAAVLAVVEGWKSKSCENAL